VGLLVISNLFNFISREFDNLKIISLASPSADRLKDKELATSLGELAISKTYLEFAA
jgi:hypothetical protein